MKAVLGVLLLLGSSVLAGVSTPVARAATTVVVIYRVTLQDPGYNRQVEIAYGAGDGSARAKYPTNLDPFVPWEKKIEMKAPGVATLGVFSDPGGNYLGEILRDGNVIASGSAYLEPSWIRTDDPYGIHVPLARADLS